MALCVAADVVFRLLLPPAELKVRYETARAHAVESDAPDIQIVGDSITHRTLLAGVFAADDSIYVRNDGLAGSSLPFTYYLLRRQFETGRVPRALIVAHTPLYFRQPHVARLAGAFLEWRELPDLYFRTHEWSEALFGTLARLSYTLMNQAAFKALLMEGDYRFFVSPSPAYEPASDRAQLAAFFASIDEPQSSPFDDLRVPRSPVFQVDPDIDRYLRRLLALAREYDVQVFWITMPIPEFTAEALRRTGFESDLEDYLRQLDMTILQAGFAVYPDETFDDLAHPRPTTAVEFSCSMRKHAARIARESFSKAHVTRERRASGAIAAALAEQAAARAKLAGICGSTRFFSREPEDLEGHTSQIGK